MHQLAHEIEAWHRRTFPVVSNEIIADKLHEEVRELQGCIEAGTPLNEEIADVLIVLVALARRNGVDPVFEAKEKMETNRQRVYRMEPDGHYTRDK